MSTKYVVNGEEVSAEEFRKHSRKRSGRLADMLESRVAPGGHACYWGGGHESISSGVPKGQAKAHHDWVQKQGLTGVTVQADGTVVTSSPGNRKAYLAARGLTDQTVAKGEGRNNRSAESVKKGQPEPLTKEERQSIRKAASEIAQSEQAKAIFNRRAR